MVAAVRRRRRRRRHVGAVARWWQYYVCIQHHKAGSSTVGLLGRRCRAAAAAAAASAIAQLILIDKFRSIVRCIFLATLLRYCIPFFSSICMLAKIYNQVFSWNFFLLGENNRKLLYGSLTLLKVNLLTENPFLTCNKCQSLYKIVFDYSSADFFLKQLVGTVSSKRACYI